MSVWFHINRKMIISIEICLDSTILSCESSMALCSTSPYRQGGLTSSAIAQASRLWQANVSLNCLSCQRFNEYERWNFYTTALETSTTPIGMVPLTGLKHPWNTRISRQYGTEECKQVSHKLDGRQLNSQFGDKRAQISTVSQRHSTVWGLRRTSQHYGTFEVSPGLARRNLSSILLIQTIFEKKCNYNPGLVRINQLQDRFLCVR